MTNKSKFTEVLLVIALLLVGVIAWSTLQGNKASSDLARSVDRLEQGLNKHVVAIEDAQDPVDRKKWTAVFLDGGSVYFGKVKEANQSYFEMTDIFYLRGEDETSLSKLGCELHGPEDKMYIYKNKINFWETLKDDGQVVKAIDEFHKQNPDGQKCV